MAPPKRLPLSHVPRYLIEEHGVEVSRQTVYNWAHKGLKGQKLHSIRVANTLYTTKEQVDAFISDRG